MINPPDGTALDKENYFLVFQFDREQIGKVNPWGEISGSVNIPLDVSTDGYGNPLLTISGTLEDVDRAHNRIERCLARIEIEDKKIDFFRRRDDAGAKIRYSAYPIIASIETSMRVFLDRAGSSIRGLAKWHMITREIFDGRIEKALAPRKNHGHTLTPLECVCLAELKKPLNPQREAREQLAKKTIKHSECNIKTDEDEIIEILERTFYLFFQKPSDWDDLNKYLQDLKYIRDDVMHQHPISLADFDELHTLEYKIEDILSHTKERLSEQELEQAQAGIDKIINILLPPLNDFCHGEEKITIIKSTESEQG